MVPRKHKAQLATVTAKTSSDSSKDTAPNAGQLKEVFANLVTILKDQGLSQQELMDLYQGQKAPPSKQSVPLDIFAGQLSPSESLCKYLKENLSLSYKEISGLLNRDERSIWTSHHRANKKFPEKFSDEKLNNSRQIPIGIFANRGLSVLENLAIYLKEQSDITSYQIAKLLNKTPSMIYTICRRAEEKLGAGKKAEPQPAQILKRPSEEPAEVLRPAQIPVKAQVRKETPDRQSKVDARPAKDAASHEPKPSKQRAIFAFGRTNLKEKEPVKRKRLRLSDYL